jgi:hypothetical protein
MGSIVDRNAIEEYQILVGATATYIKSAASLCTRLNTWQKLKNFQYISFTKQCGHFFNLFNGNVNGTHASRILNGLFRVSLNHHFFQKCSIIKVDS